jgi:WhiB family transcriptional regulator, redox-sensing transcriptional regulator
VDAQVVMAWLMDPSAVDLPHLEDFLNRPEWHARAKCRGVGTERFFVSSRTFHAREICQECPVRQECLDYAMGEPDLIGVFGGTSWGQRKKMRRDEGY